MSIDQADILDYEHFLHTLRALGAKLYHAPALHSALLKAWEEPHRIFYNRTYLCECLGHLSSQRWGASIEPLDRQRLALALWFYGAVYDTKAFDSKDKSAAWAMQSLALLDLSQDDLNTVASLILSTKLPQATSESPLHAWMHDIDLHVLGSSEERFAQYTHQIRDEFYWVDDLNYRRGRDFALRRLLAFPSGVFHTPSGREAYEQCARKNILGYLQKLQDAQFILAPSPVSEDIIL